MAMRMSGLMSGLDTESIVQQLVEARSTKVKKAKDDQTKLEWKQDIWKGLNTKLKNLQSKLNDLRFTGGYAKKTTKISDSSVASILTSGEAMNTVQSLEVNQMAKTAYLTGDKVQLKAGVTGGDVNALTPLKFLMDFKDGETKTITLEKDDGTKVDIDLTGDDSISDVLTQFKNQGLNASFDANQSRFYISAKEVGQAGNFMLTGDHDVLFNLGLGSGVTTNKITTTAGGRVTGDTTMANILGLSAGKDVYMTMRTRDGKTANVALTGEMSMSEMVDALKKQGVNITYDENQQRLYMTDSADVSVVFSSGSGYSEQDLLQRLGFSTRIGDDGEVHGQASWSAGHATFAQGQDAMIRLNGVTYTSSNNVFEVNGLTITAQAPTEPGKSVTLTTSQDTDGIYDMIKDFFKAYNEVMDEMDKLYGADAAKDYAPLTDDEKASMSESEIEKYENKIKDSLLRKDSNLSVISSALKEVMLKGVTVNGKKMVLANFGIETLNYFLAKDGQRNSYHIDGDSDDENTSANEDKLKKMITTDPDTVESFFSQLTMNLYTTMDKQSKAVENTRSFGSFYDDKKMKSDYDSYKSKIKDLEDKLADYEDKWYKKFAKMETAMAKMQNNASAVTGLLGGN